MCESCRDLSANLPVLWNTTILEFHLQELPLIATTTLRHPNDLTNRRQDEAQPENLKEPLPQGLLVNSCNKISIKACALVDRKNEMY
jgi:hypothetical protein